MRDSFRKYHRRPLYPPLILLSFFITREEWEGGRELLVKFTYFERLSNDDMYSASDPPPVKRPRYDPYPTYRPPTTPPCSISVKLAVTLSWKNTVEREIPTDLDPETFFALSSPPLLASNNVSVYVGASRQRTEQKGRGKQYRFHFTWKNIEFFYYFLVTRFLQEDCQEFVAHLFSRLTPCHTFSWEEGGAGGGGEVHNSFESHWSSNELL